MRAVEICHLAAIEEENVMLLNNQVDKARMAAFHALDHVQKRAAITGLALAGYSDRAISAATQLSVEQICRVLSESWDTDETGGLRGTQANAR
jgi:hypothetical protein